MFNVRFAHALQTHFFDEFRDTHEPCPHIFGQRLDLQVDGTIEALDSPAQILIYQKRYWLGVAAG